jgi:hypothetical protein
VTHPLNLDRLSRRLGHAFRQPQLLRQALTHRSYSATNNERFEFIGDSILNYTVARMLYDRFTQFSEYLRYFFVLRYKEGVVNLHLGSISHDVTQLGFP